MIGLGLHRWWDCAGRLHVWRGLYTGARAVADCTRAAGHILPALVALPFVVAVPAGRDTYEIAAPGVPGGYDLGWEAPLGLGAAAGRHDQASLLAVSPWTDSAATWANTASRKRERVTLGLLPGGGIAVLPPTYSLATYASLPRGVVTGVDTPTPVPEPGSIAVFAAGVLLLVATQRRRPQ